jgi:hypothetical protein
MLKRKLKRYTFANLIEMMTEMNTLLSQIPLEEFVLVFDKWKRRLRECIDLGGKYKICKKSPTSYLAM